MNDSPPCANTIPYRLDKQYIVRYIFSCNYSRYLFASLRSFCPYFASSHVVQYMVVVAPGSGNAPAVTEEVALGMQALSRSGGVIVLRSL